VLYLGLDLGAVSVKAALLGSGRHAEQVCRMAGPSGRWHPEILRPKFPAGEEVAIAVSAYRRTRGRPMEATRLLLEGILSDLGLPLDGVRVTGSGAGLLASCLGVAQENDFRALVGATRVLVPQARALFEIGGESSKILIFERDDVTGDLGVSDYQTNGDWAAGTGSFLDQQAGRLRIPIEQVG
jgi:activator of 2-hydroxyglutaryl-CoA dehydratase